MSSSVCIIIIMIKYWVNHNNDNAFLSIVLGLLLSTVLCRSVGSGSDVQETSMGSVTELAVGSGGHISFCLSKV